MTQQIFSLPDVGEGLTEAEIVSWKVQPGQTVAINDVICEIETAKSLVELPSPYAGTVVELLAGEHVTIEVGTPIIAIGDAVQAHDAAPAPSAPASPSAAVESPVPTMQEPGVESGPLVGSGPKADAAKRRPRRQTPAAPHQPTTPTVVPAGDSTPSGAAAEASQKPEPGNAVVGLLSRVLAKPPVRRIAKELGINLSDVPATGARGEVTRADLESYQAQREREQAAAPTFWDHTKRPSERRVEVVPVRGVRRATAKAMVDSAFSAPHVSIFVDVDASRTMEFVQRLKKSRDFEGVKVSPLLILAKAVIWAAARNPSVNSEWVAGPGGDEIHIKHYMNLGIAAATPRGLLVPNIKDAQDLSLRELAIALNELATTARAGKTKPADMQGGTMTITNIGALGIDIGTPIINPGEVAIVAFGTIRQKPWVVSGEVIPRWITTLGGSFDHRVVDGDLSARFMADVAAIMEEPALLLD
ncbi:Pyruvate/2-oxoglutarate dehydrogenase complex, dihydrolipoamide acyltransferase component [Sinomonas atrocyanea]|uniref:Dihydrolipoamide acetyltransferase component of pyruvate dehydrogenase complex n=1 Tax=Sinomonas atrocyanea TaxID=37927 RepID=A0A127A6H2_9MICC|nr:dihydrolipoamide acetyltransferase family protein [Sinomonas atrocyanea]AMM34374.1 Pyruvate/2-oxoglutarate dehydrogenase complex, dihydrolipoamide acyltransferase component [Sinomonas atrocyanea]GEB64543.1 dihydrolipoamide acetyltransferase component of pyruvate dehydrogenase complex [Sinomonas atrocyanea]GGG68416.1 dihydrolipoamide acetyltransferase component of pyruvate dehydrogenase complex [Sinomonas atrocyanea]